MDVNIGLMSYLYLMREYNVFYLFPFFLGVEGMVFRRLMIESMALLKGYQLSSFKNSISTSSS